MSETVMMWTGWAVLVGLIAVIVAFDKYDGKGY